MYIYSTCTYTVHVNICDYVFSYYYMSTVIINVHIQYMYIYMTVHMYIHVTMCLVTIICLL